MNEKQKRVEQYILTTFTKGAVTITVDGPESLLATDGTGESLVFWYDERLNQVLDAHHWPEAYAAWRAGHTILAHGAAYTVLRRNVKTPQPFVVAWKYDEKTGTWEQGHYFSYMSEAMVWFAAHDPANCDYCEYTCPYRDRFCRLPEELGGQGLCRRLEDGGMYADY